MLRLKTGVSLSDLAPAGERIRAAFEMASDALGIDLTLTCTTADHKPEDHHSKGEAIDCRTYDLSADEIVSLYRFMGVELGPGFTVLYEVPIGQRDNLDPRVAELVYAPSNPNAQHLHVQLRNNTTFVPAPVA